MSEQRFGDLHIQTEQYLRGELQHALATSHSLYVEAIQKELKRREDKGKSNE